MKYPSVNDFIKSHIRYKQHWHRKIVKMTDAKWQELSEDTMLMNTPFAKGSRFKVFETENFGWVVFGPESLTPDGHTPNQRIFKW